MPDTVFFKKCPRCQCELVVAYQEHIQYPLTSVTDAAVLEIDSDKGEPYYAQVIHIVCDNCSTYWYAVHDLVEECKKAAKEKEACKQTK